jgi:hypothetical protein
MIGVCEISPHFTERLIRSLTALIGPTHFPHYAPTYLLFSSPVPQIRYKFRGELSNKGSGSDWLKRIDFWHPGEEKRTRGIWSNYVIL